MISARSVRNAIAVCLVMVSATAAGTLAQAGNCQYPLFVQQSSTEANVIILFDNSGSMNTPVYHSSYDPDQTYSGNFNNNNEYYVSRNGDYRPRDFNRNWSTTPTAPLVTSDGGQSARYPGNYLNWIFFHATDAERADLSATLTRVQTAKAAIGGFIDSTDGVRFSIWRFNTNSDGGVPVTPLTTDKNRLQTDLAGIVANGWTPLAETMEDIYDQLYDNNSMIQYYCQKTFIVVMTDGYPTQDINVNARFRDYDNDGNDPGNCASVGAPNPNSDNCSDYLDDVAAYLYRNDLMPGLDGPDAESSIQNASTYTIGFGVDAGILQETADNGGGLYFNANDATELETSLESVLRDIVSKLSAGSAVSIVSAEGVTSSSRVYRAKFKPGTWTGYLEAFELPYRDGNAPLWSAHDILNSRDTALRKIYTSTTGSNKEVFEPRKGNDLKALMGLADGNIAADVINWTRGNDVAGYRDREGWVLGDVIDSSPVAVGPPANFHDFLNYSDFQSRKKSREAMVYLGANDGMIHAFGRDSGMERWAYVPRNQLIKLKDIADPSYCHQYSVDGTPSVFDAYVDGAWKTLMVVGQREGGNGYTCLDITDPGPGAFEVMWDKEFPIVNQSWSQATLVRDRQLDKHLLTVGTGPEDFGTSRLVQIEAKTGDVIGTFDLGSGAPVNMSTTPVVIDLDLDGYDDVLYIADLTGDLWRFDLSTSPWTKTKLYDGYQPIQAQPILTVNDKGDIMLYFGTGKYIEGSDISNTDPQTFYCVIDNHSGSTVQRSDLVDETYSITTLGPTDGGWYLDLVQSPGERVTRPDALAAGTVYFTSYAPTDETCRAGGSAWFYQVDFLDGTNPDNDDGTEDDGTDKRVVALGDGINSEPIIDMVNEDVITQSTDTGIDTRDTKGTILRILVRSWRQAWD